MSIEGAFSDCIANAPAPALSVCSDLPMGDDGDGLKRSKKEREVEYELGESGAMAAEKIRQLACACQSGQHVLLEGRRENGQT